MPSGKKPTKKSSTDKGDEKEASAEKKESVPDFVKDANPAQRKAAAEQAAIDAGIAPVLARAPWRRAGGATESREKAPAEKPARKEPLRMQGDKRAEDEGEDAGRQEVGVTGARPVILDTNALMMQFQFHIDIEQELKRLLDFKHEIIVPSIVVDELKNLADEAKGKDAGEARMALALAKTFRIMDAPGQGDTGILRLGEKLNAVVVTNDKLLRARLRAKDIPNIYMRSSAFLTVEGHIPGI